DPEKAGTVIRFVDLSTEVLTGDLTVVLDKIVEHVESMSPAIVVVDSFRTVLRSSQGLAGELELQGFLQRLALHLTSWQVTSFLVGEYVHEEMKDNPVFTVADGIIWLSQHRERSSVVRKLDVLKMRGMATMPGLHTFRISGQGIQIFPRSISFERTVSTTPRLESNARAAFGVAGVDEMLGGGPPAGDATLIAGPSGTGKTMLSTHFIAEGVARGEHGVLAVFEEQPEDYLLRAKQMGYDLGKMAEQGQIKLIYLRPLDLSAEEILYQIQQAVTQLDAKRLVIDSLNGVELALASTFREDFRDSLYRLVSRLTSAGVSVLMTVEVVESFNEIKFSPHAISFLAQNIVFLRYVEIESQLRKMMAVVKMRRSQHSHELREYELTNRGVRVLGPFREHEGMLTGVAKPRTRVDPARRVGLSEAEQQTLDVLLACERISAPELALKTALHPQTLEVALGRLHALNYILESTENGQTLYSALERPLGGRSRQP
ncbi:MAG: putative circadian clock protein KaiC, partial [Myxococcaceae bacterium]|nr:putative circadian clock protein KaiC [Myxococcaceae bacterium]